MKKACVMMIILPVEVKTQWLGCWCGCLQNTSSFLNVLPTCYRKYTQLITRDFKEDKTISNWGEACLLLYFTVKRGVLCIITLMVSIWLFNVIKT